ncbi:MAG: hypothetical protein KBT28_12915 [Bacteroidales bacterium]|nr:hypothetical protein [Candidatus Colimorpha merdihippi]
MNGLNSTYCQAILNATFSSTFVGSTFTGKEKDAESGYHYFGARYYDSEALTGWLSVVPMADKYLGFSSYQYCRWNPVKRIVVDGLFDTEKEAQKAHKKAAKRFGSERVGEIFNRGTEKNLIILSLSMELVRIIKPMVNEMGFGRIDRTKQLVTNDHYGFIL